MSDNIPEKLPSADLAADTVIFAEYLNTFGLPTDNIIASTSERKVVSGNLPHFLQSLSAEDKRSARYLSKFIGATAIGLFDAALNYIWNEVVLNLRKKAIVYGIDSFYDAAVGGKNREDFKNENDIDGLKDSVLLDTCLKLELISDVVYRKLDHILTMRNEVAASHPNVESIGGFELLGWLQTCVKDVLQDRPSESAIRIKSLIANIKSRTNILDEPTASRFCDELRNLSLAHVQNLLVTLFGIFVSSDTVQILRANVGRIAPAVWECADDNVKYKIGTLIDGYRTNFEQEKLDKGVEFLTLVNGRMYETLPAKVIALTNIADRLDDAHDGWDNFHHEPSIMREILQFCRNSNDIPQEVLPKLTRVVLRCRIGRGLSYRQGVSPTGLPLYDKFLSMLDDAGIINCVICLFHPDMNPKLANPICQNHLLTVLSNLRLIAITDRLKQVLDYLLADIPRARHANMISEFQQLSAPLIRWSRT